MINRIRTLIVGLITVTIFSLVIIFLTDEISTAKMRLCRAVSSAQTVGDFYFVLRNPVDKLDIVNISMDRLDLKSLKKSLSKTPIKKKWYKVKAKVASKEFEAKLKLHGSGDFHFERDYFSFDLKFKDANAKMNYARRLNAINGCGFDSNMSALHEVAKAQGLITGISTPYLISINEKILGHYYLNEKVEKELLERDYGITTFVILEDSDPVHSDFKNDSFPEGISPNAYYNLVEFDNKWEFHREARNQYRSLWKAVVDNDTSAVFDAFDSEYLLKFLAFSNLAQSRGYDSQRIIDLVYDFSRGKFYPVFQCRVPLCDNSSNSNYNSVNYMLISQVSKMMSVFTKQAETKFSAQVDSVSDAVSKDLRTTRITRHSTKRNEDLSCAKLNLEDLEKVEFETTTNASIAEDGVRGLTRQGIRFSVSDNSLTVHRGQYRITSDIVLQSKYDLNLENGVTFVLDSGVNVLVKGNLLINGTKKLPVIIKATSKEKPFGCFAVVASKKATEVNIDNLHVSGGSFNNFQGLAFTGQFAIYGATVRIRNSTFTESSGDDGLNIKYGKVELDSCNFVTNMADQVDLDFCLAKISNCTFSPSGIDPNGDGLDLSGSYAMVSMCQFKGFSDKGLSLGEKSKVFITKNRFSNNYNAVAVKDQTASMFDKNRFRGNHRDVISYVKKPIFKLPNIMMTIKSDSLRIAVVEGDLVEIQSDGFLSGLSAFEDAFDLLEPTLELGWNLRLSTLIGEK